MLSFYGYNQESFYMNIQPDFEELLRLLEKNHIEYMVVGGYAVALHGYPRFTKDIDVFFDPNPANITKLQKALIEFGFLEAEIPFELLSSPGNIIAFGVEPVRIDLMNSIDGVTFNDAKKSTIRSSYGNVTVTVIGLQELIKNKCSTPRLKDQADAEELRKIHPDLNP